MDTNTRYPIFMLSSVALLLSGCGGGGETTGSSTSSTLTTTQIGQFLDAPVANVEYQTATHSGVTDDNGYFEYLPGETVTFRIGNITLGTTLASSTVTPLNIANTSDSSDSHVTNLIRFLQSLDNDADPDNGIHIDDDVKDDSLDDIDFDRDEVSFENDADVQALIAAHSSNSGNLVSTNDALLHFTSQLSSADIIASPIVGTWTLPATNSDANELLVYVFLDNGNYLNVTIDNQLAKGIQYANGLEFGQYQIDNANLYQTQASYDENRLSGLTSSLTTIEKDAGVSGNYVSFNLPDSTTLNLTLDNYLSGSLNSSESHQLEKVTANAANPIVGTWLLYSYESDRDHAYRELEDFAYLFLENGQYVKLEIDGDSHDDDMDGAEWGTYTYNATSGVLQLLDYNDYSYHDYDDDGEDDYEDEYLKVTINGDVLTLSEVDDGRTQNSIYYRQ